MQNHNRNIWDKKLCEIENAYGYIYITTNNINGKRYIGQKKFNRNWKNYLGSGLLLAKAIKKYGAENFSKEIIDIAFTVEELNEKEMFYISFFNAHNSEDFYNIQLGGSQTPCAESTKKKISDANRGRYVGEKHPMYGKHHTEESRKKMSASLKGHTPHNKGIPMSEEQKEKLKIARQVNPRRYHKPVRCIETGEIFDSIRDAEIAKGIYQGGINRALKGERQTTAGDYHWEFVS
jgi:group I intron endonuclease